MVWLAVRASEGRQEAFIRASPAGGQGPRTWSHLDARSALPGHRTGSGSGFWRGRPGAKPALAVAEPWSPAPADAGSGFHFSVGEGAPGSSDAQGIPSREAHVLV